MPYYSPGSGGGTTITSSLATWNSVPLTTSAIGNQTFQANTSTLVFDNLGLDMTHAYWQITNPVANGTFYKFRVAVVFTAWDAGNIPSLYGNTSNFDNRGSFTALGGYCAGSAVLSIDYESQLLQAGVDDGNSFQCGTSAISIYIPSAVATTIAYAGYTMTTYK